MIDDEDWDSESAPYILMGMQEIGAKLGVKPETVHQWRLRKYLKFPLPFTILGTKPIWLWADVSEWAQRTNRMPKPKKHDPVT